MKLLDYWMLYLYHFVRFSIQCDESSWRTARIYLSFFVFAFVMDIFTTLCLLMINLNICEQFLEFVRVYIEVIFVILGTLCCIITVIYYWKEEHVKRIEKSYNALTKKQRWTVKIFIYLLEIILPVYLFVSFRLVLFGQVKWWD